MKQLLRKALLALPLILLGCAGYQLGNIPGGDMKNVKAVWVPMVKNNTFTPYLQPLLTNAIIHSFDDDGTFQTGRAADSEATVNVTIVKVERDPINQNPDNSLQTSEFKLTLRAKVTLTNTVTGKVIFKDKDFDGSTTYYVPNFNYGGDNVEAERQATPMACQKLAQNIVHQVTEGW